MTVMHNQQYILYFYFLFFGHENFKKCIYHTKLPALVTAPSFLLFGGPLRADT